MYNKSTIISNTILFLHQIWRIRYDIINYDIVLQINSDDLTLNLMLQKSIIDFIVEHLKIYNCRNYGILDGISIRGSI